MRFRVVMKDPDTLYDAVKEAVDENLANIDDLSENEREQLAENRAEDIKEIAGIWFDYGEYLTVEIDTELKTCTVIKVGE